MFTHIEGKTELRATFRGKLKKVWEGLQKPDGFRNHLGKNDWKWKGQETCGPLEDYLSTFLTRGIRPTVGVTFQAVRVTDYKGGAYSDGWPIVELHAPGWTRAFIERWFDAWQKHYDATIHNRMTPEAGLFDEDGYIHSAEVLRLLDQR